MGKKKSNPEVTETKPIAAVEPSRTPVEINGKTYDLCFDFKALAFAERELKRQGHRFSLLLSLFAFDMQGIQDSFPALLFTHHSEISFEEAQAMVTLKTMDDIALAIAGAINGVTTAAEVDIRSMVSE
jgi:hypothetical protein